MSVQEEKLTAIADAIREKEGTTAAIPATEFPSRIRGIETGVQLEPPRTSNKPGTIVADLHEESMGTAGTITVNIKETRGYKDALILFPTPGNPPVYNGTTQNFYCVTTILVLPVTNGNKYFPTALACMFFGEMNNAWVSTSGSEFIVQRDDAGDVWTINLPVPNYYSVKIPSNIETFQCSVIDIFE